MSAVIVATRPAVICSGDMYGVPTNSPVTVMPGRSSTRASPKSLTASRPEDSRMLAGLTSQVTRPGGRSPGRRPPRRSAGPPYRSTARPAQGTMRCRSGLAPTRSGRPGTERSAPGRLSGVGRSQRWADHRPQPQLADDPIEGGPVDQFHRVEVDPVVLAGGVDRTILVWRWRLGLGLRRNRSTDFGLRPSPGPRTLRATERLRIPAVPRRPLPSRRPISRTISKSPNRRPRGPEPATPGPPDPLQAGHAPGQAASEGARRWVAGGGRPQPAPHRKRRAGR